MTPAALRPRSTVPPGDFDSFAAQVHEAVLRELHATWRPYRRVVLSQELLELWALDLAVFPVGTVVLLYRAIPGRRLDVFVNRPAWPAGSGPADLIRRIRKTRLGLCQWVLVSDLEQPASPAEGDTHGD